MTLPDIASVTERLRQSKVFSLGRDLHMGIPHGPTHSPYLFSLIKKHGQVMYRGGVSSVTDMFSMGCHVGTHMDALGHVSCNGMLHGGLRAEEVQSFEGGLSRCGAHELGNLMVRGVLVDMPRHRGVGRLAPTDGVTAADLEAVCRANGTDIGPGDAVLVRTGWAQHWPNHAEFHANPCPGITLDAAQWLGDRGVSCVGADNYACEQVPSPGLPVHVELLVNRGIPILEMLVLEDLAASGATTFLFVALPLKIKGGSGSPLNPVAII